MVQEPSTRRHRIRRTLEEIRELYRQYEEGAQSAEAFAQQHGIGVSTLHSWHRRLKGASARTRKPKWVEVRSHLASPGCSHGVEIRLPNGISLSAPVSEAGPRLMALVRSLREL